MRRLLFACSLPAWTPCSWRPLQKSKRGTCQRRSSPLTRLHFPLAEKNPRWLRLSINKCQVLSPIIRHAFSSRSPFPETGEGTCGQQCPGWGPGHRLRGPRLESHSCADTRASSLTTCVMSMTVPSRRGCSEDETRLHSKGSRTLILVSPSNACSSHLQNPLSDPGREPFPIALPS